MVVKISINRSKRMYIYEYIILYYIIQLLLWASFCARVFVRAFEIRKSCVTNKNQMGKREKKLFWKFNKFEKVVKLSKGKK